MSLIKVPYTSMGEESFSGAWQPNSSYSTEKKISFQQPFAAYWSFGTMRPRGALAPLWRTVDWPNPLFFVSVQPDRRDIHPVHTTSWGEQLDLCILCSRQEKMHFLVVWAESGPLTGSLHCNLRAVQCQNTAYFKVAGDFHTHYVVISLSLL